MRPHHFIHVSGIAAFAAIASTAVLAYAQFSTQAATVPEAPEPTKMQERPVETEKPAKMPEIPAEPKAADLTEAGTELGWPISNALKRVTKKTFGMEIHPETSPVPNDRFHGFHVGVDFEILPGEENVDVPIFAICDGPLLIKQFAGGYGGYALQACKIDGQDVRVLYGHMDLKNIEPDPQTMLNRGDKIGILGEGETPETDGVRKHLHLGIHKGTEIDIRGYVRDTNDINKWIDVLPYLQ